jgi:type IV pilus assembly protein PilN
MYLYKVNLLPPRLQHEGILDIRRLIAVTGALLGAAVILGCYATFLINYAVIKTELTETKAQLASLAPVTIRVDGIVKERTAIEETIKELDEISSKHTAWSSLLYDLGSAAPADLWLTGLDISNKNAAAGEKAAKQSTTGPALNTSVDSSRKEANPYARPNHVTCKGLARSLPSIGKFIKNMLALPYFEEVQLIKANAVNEGVEFEITARVKDKG